MKDTIVHEFKTYLNLSRFVDSMLFDAGTLIASIFATKGEYTVSAKLKVAGAASVKYRNRVYHAAFDFPTGLRKRIAEHPGNWQHIDGKKDVQVYLNNWFEYQWVIEGPDFFSKSGSMLCEDDLRLMTEDKLKAKMLEVVYQVIEENSIPNEERAIAKIHGCKITDEKIKRTIQVLRDNGMDEDQAYTVLEAIGYTLLDTELFPEDK